VRTPIFAALLMAASLVAGTTRAQPLADGGGDAGQADALQVEIDRDWASLQNADCATACRALDSMRHAADRLCALDQGDRCARAQQRVRDATDRVRATCPDCAAANKEEQAKVPAAGEQPQETSATAPPAEQRGGGCAACAVGMPSVDGGGGGAAAAAAALVALALARTARRQRRR